jgi:hypothetical protein
MLFHFLPCYFFFSQQCVCEHFNNYPRNPSLKVIYGYTDIFQEHVVTMVLFCAINIIENLIR